MNVPAPHFLLYAEAGRSPCGEAAESGAWRFVLSLPGGEKSLEAADEELEATPQRLELLAVVRGLEALSQPSRVTLLTGSRYLRRGLDFGIPQWRENDWQWERYGRMAPVKNSDLWQRLDRLLAIHDLECKPTRLDKTDDLAPPPRRMESPVSKRGGRTVRIDGGHGAAKSQIRNSKRETNSKLKMRNVRNRSRLQPSNFVLLGLFRLSSFVLRVLKYGMTQFSQIILAHILRSTNEEL